MTRSLHINWFGDGIKLVKNMKDLNKSIIEKVSAVKNAEDEHLIQRREWVI